MKADDYAVILVMKVVWVGKKLKTQGSLLTEITLNEFVLCNFVFSPLRLHSLFSGLNTRKV